LRNKKTKNEAAWKWVFLSAFVFFGIVFIMSNIMVSRNISKIEDKVSSVVTSSVKFREDLFGYQNLFKDLYVEQRLMIAPDENEKVVYLTFDLSPTNKTLEILKVLDEYNVKATFFVVGDHSEGMQDVYKRIVRRGHTIGIRSYSEDYDKIYSSIPAYLEDFDKTFNLIYDVCGVYPEVFRFPGGSINAYSQPIHKELIAEMLRRGFSYFDYNAYAQNRVAGTTPHEVADSMLKGVRTYNRVFIKADDIGDDNLLVEALPTLIKTARNEGYNFEKLNNGVYPLRFAYPDNG